MWEVLIAEPRWLAIMGLGMDLAGGALVATTAWFRIKTASTYGGPGGEPEEVLRLRRSFVYVGGSLLTLGFGLQIWATWLQIPA